jgi:hypothetical protein
MARAVPEPKAAPAGDHASAACANCGVALAGAYCHACGQQAHLHDKLGDLVHEIVEGVAHLDGRIWRTLPLLTFNPGRLTREWMAGKRVRYLAPLHVFLFSMFLLFLVPTFTGQRLINIQPSTFGPVTVSDLQIDGVSDPSRFERLARDLSTTMQQKSADGRYYSYKIESLAYKLTFVLAPLAMAFLALVTWRRSRRVTAYQHGVVALYGLGFAALVGSIVLAAPPAIDPLLGQIAMVVLPAHAVAHLRGAYGFGWWSAILRGLILCLLTLVGFLLFLVGVSYLGLFA